MYHSSPSLFSSIQSYSCVLAADAGSPGRPLICARNGWGTPDFYVQDIEIALSRRDVIAGSSAITIVRLNRLYNLAVQVTKEHIVRAGLTPH